MTHRLPNDLTRTELGYLTNVTSDIQTQISGKAASSHIHAQSDVTNLTTDLAAKAPLASPTFTGTVTLPTLVGSDTTDASSSITGAFKTAGGMGVAKKLYVGTDLSVGGYVTGDLSFSNGSVVLAYSSSTWTNPGNNSVPSIAIGNGASGATSHANLYMHTDATGGDPFISLDVDGVNGWSVGVDNSDNESFKIANSWDNIGTNTAVTIDTNRNFLAKRPYAFKAGTSGSWTDGQHKVIDLGTYSNISGISHSSGTFTVTYAGIYQIHAGILGPGGTGSCYMDLYVGGVQDLKTFTNGAMSAFGWWNNINATIALSAGDTFAIYAAQTSGATRTPTSIRVTISMLSTF